MTDIQSLIDQAVTPATVTVPPGIYDVDAVDAPIRWKSDLTLDLTGVILRVIPTTVEHVYAPLQMVGCSRTALINGVIQGDRIARGASALSPLGHGILIGGSQAIIRGTQFRNFFGDGIYAVGANTVDIGNVVADSCQRQGMTFSDSSTLYIHDNQFSNNGMGADPGDGIDFENELDNQTIAGVLVTRNTFFGNRGSDVSFSGPGKWSNLRVAPDNSFTMKTQPIWIAGNAGSLGTPWWAFALNRVFGKLPSYRYWGYPTQWSKA